MLAYGRLVSRSIRSPCRQLVTATRQCKGRLPLSLEASRCQSAWRWPIRCCSGSTSTEERIAKLETEVQSLKQKLTEVEKIAKRKGFIAAMMEYGAPFALWYAFCWSGSLLGLYLLLEWEVVSWQKSLRPFFESLGLDWYTERIDSSTGNLVIAFMVNELLEAVRFPLVLATSGTIIRWSARFRTAAKP
ncbi:Uncharacterized protein SCF082_LOCUS38510 [Durusdinium trenchii]|uniref:DUF1279 domain-containing protein n=1 Tax=Durusdinium trenchii TaxID=1381693 RepID=A0ABP0PXT4_9DINO